MRGTLIACLFGISLFLFLAATGGAAAQGESITMDRDGGEIRIGVDAAEFDTDAGNATLELGIEGESATVDGASEEGDRYVFRYPLASIADRLDYRHPTGNVTVRSPVSTTQEVDLRTFAFGPGGSSADGVFRFEALTLGLDSTDVPVSVTAGGETTETEASLAVNANGSTLLLDPRPLEGAIPLVAEQVEIRAFPDDPTIATTRDPVRLPEIARTTIDVDEELTVGHPLVFDGTEYGVGVETATPDGRYTTYVDGVRGESAGEIDLPARLVFADSTTITVARDGAELVDSRELMDAERTPERVNATVDDSGRVTLEDTLAGTIQTVWIDDGDRIRQASAVEATDDGFVVGDGTVAADGTYRFLVVTDAGIVRVIASGDSATAVDAGAQSVALAVVAGAIGTGVGAGLILFTARLLGESSMRGGILRNKWIGSGVYLLLCALALAAILTTLEGQLRMLGALAVAGAVAPLGLLRRASFPIAGLRRSVPGIVVGLVGSLAVAGVVTLVDGSTALRASSGLLVSGLLGQSVAVGALGYLVATGRVSATDDGRHELTLELVDGRTGHPVSGPIELRFERTDGDRARTVGPETVDDGSYRVDLDEGWWKVLPSTGGGDAIEIQLESDRAERIELTPPPVPIEVLGGAGRPIAGATITADAPGGSRTTDNDGRVSVPTPIGAEAMDVEIDHELYEPRTVTVAADPSPKSVELSPKTGTLTVSPRLDGDAVAGVPVVASARTDVGADRDVRIDARTDGSGRIRFDGRRLPETFDGIPIGEYELGVDDSALSAIEADTTTVSVTEDGTTASIALRFSFELRTQQRRRIDSLRSGLDALGTDPQRDTAIQTYYGSVVAELLETIETLPSEGHRFVGGDVEPNAVVEGLLSAAEAADRRIASAMSDAQCDDLFAACSDMEATRVDWRGEFTVSELFELLEESPAERRRRLAARRESVRERLDRELADLSETAPAEAMMEQIGELIRDARNSDPVESAAVALVGMALLDAIDSLFDEPALRKRLSRTVF